MDAPRALSEVLHRTRYKKPEALVADECDIARAQLRKYRSGVHRVHVDEWIRLIRCTYEVDHAGAAILAQSGLPSELFQATPINGTPSNLQREIIQAGAAFGKISAAFLEATRDGKYSPDELDEIQIAYEGAMKECGEGVAAIEKEREKKHIQ